MLQDVVITMHSEHGVDNNDTDTIDFTTDGIWKTDDGGEVGYLTYAESEVTGLTGTTTQITVLPDKVVIDRIGLMNSRMVFEEGTKSSFLYQTPFGNTMMGIRTKKINRGLTRNGGKLEIDYVLDFDHAVATKNRFSIEVRHA